MPLAEQIFLTTETARPKPWGLCLHHLPRLSFDGENCLHIFIKIHVFFQIPNHKNHLARINRISTLTYIHSSFNQANFQIITPAVLVNKIISKVLN